AVRAMDPLEHVRYVVWFSHVVMLDKNAQDNGVIIVEDCAKIGFWKMCTLMPMDLGAKLDRLTIGILPVKMKAFYIYGTATWMTVMINMMKPFMSKKMKERMICLNEKKTDLQAFFDDLVTRQKIPKYFSGLKGEVEKDAFLTAFMNK
ncbi:MAG: hypothetical protein SGARI_005086, partial [Bacillariaceae sp.]